MLTKNNKIQFEFEEIKYLTEEILDATGDVYNSINTISHTIRKYAEDEHTISHCVMKVRLSPVFKDINCSLARINRAATQLVPKEEENIEV